MAAHLLLENRTCPGSRDLDPLLGTRRLSQAHSVRRSIGRCELCVQLEGGEFRQRDETWAFAVCLKIEPTRMPPLADDRKWPVSDVEATARSG